jgi:hypothetical protein
MNQSDNEKKSSIYWNLPQVAINDTPYDDFQTTNSLLYLTMTLSLAKTLRDQSPLMSLSILRNLLESWCSFRPLSFQRANETTLLTFESLETFTVDIIMNQKDFQDNESLQSGNCIFIFCLQIICERG